MHIVHARAALPLLTSVLLLALGLVVLIAGHNALTRRVRTSIRSRLPCSLPSVGARDAVGRSTHPFFERLRRETVRAPVVAAQHRFLCDAQRRWLGDWTYCLPMSGRTDEPLCAQPDRMDLISADGSFCAGSVLHMLLLDVYEELRACGGRPALLFGSLLGAVRNGSIIPFTEDVDLGYRVDGGLRLRVLQDALWRKGYHLFRDGVLRVCVAPTHPLAGRLYDPSLVVHRRSSRHVPYADLYRMWPSGRRDGWRIQGTRSARVIRSDKFEPYRTVAVNGERLETLADPVDFLEDEYGPDWRVPLRRDQVPRGAALPAQAPAFAPPDAPMPTQSLEPVEALDAASIGRAAALDAEDQEMQETRRPESPASTIA
ncbi:hypothetical protein P43SY_008543 [Pythium insidiosum]|uniref:LicD family protein n=1 Tax=Pythium insidiosum TaxID=114742 RepID=A0AAD5LTV5_PYTIN|nr:hypothetical protein P43SY_008543 [Pythium insidiosum]